MLNITNKKLLMIAPHVDDEIGGIPLILRLQKEGWECHIVYFSFCEKSVVALGFKKEDFVAENKKVLQLLGIQQSCVHYFDYPVREFSQHRQCILEDLIQMRQQLHPSLVITPSTGDVHQDHKTVNEETIRCFKNSATIIGFTYPWNEVDKTTHNLFIEVNASVLDTIGTVIDCYKVQKARKYMSPEIFRAISIATGVKVHLPHAFSYEIIRMRYPF